MDRISVISIDEPQMRVEKQGTSRKADRAGQLRIIRDRAMPDLSGDMDLAPEKDTCALCLRPVERGLALFQPYEEYLAMVWEGAKGNLAYNA